MRLRDARHAIRAPRRLPLALAPLLLCLPALAQDAGPRRSVNLEPAFTTSLSLIDLRRPGGVDSSEAVLTLQPSLRLSANTGRVKGAVQYALSGVTRSGGGKSEFVNALNGSASAELVPQWAYVEGSAVVSQSALSAYGQQSASLATPNANRGEVATVSVSPFVRGAAAGLFRYEARLTAAGTNVRRSKVGDSSSQGAVLSLGSASDGPVGWGLEGSTNRSHYRLGRDTQVDRVLASASFRPDPEYTISVRGGQERSDVLSLDPRSYDNWGAGARWTPTERTIVSGDFDRRYFGDAYSLQMTHRMPLSSVRVASSRSAVTGGVGGGGQLVSVTLYQLYDLLLTSRFPDPVQRDVVVRQLLGTRNPNELVQGGFVADRSIQLTRRDEIGWTYGLQRLSLNLVAFRTSSRSLDALVTDARSGQTRQQGYTSLVSYRLTPTASLTVNGSMLQTFGNQTLPGTNLKSVSLGWNDTLGRYASVTANARYSIFNSTTDAYREAALTASLSLRF